MGKGFTSRVEVKVTASLFNITFLCMYSFQIFEMCFHTFCSQSGPSLFPVSQPIISGIFSSFVCICMQLFCTYSLALQQHEAMTLFSVVESS